LTNLESKSFVDSGAEGWCYLHVLFGELVTPKQRLHVAEADPDDAS
jgi:hypothetical protein